MKKWKDITSYSQRDTDRTPRTWELKTSGLSIIVTRHRDYNKEDWLLKTDFFAPMLISNGTADEAKKAAIKAVRGRLQAILIDLE